MTDQLVHGPSEHRERRDRLVLRFAGDSGDGMQLTGARFTDASAAFGNDLATLPNFPAEIRAPQGTLPGVSSFQIQIADEDILTPGDSPQVLVAMNPAALKANVADVAPGGLILVNSDAFTERNFDKCGYEADPLADGSLSDFRVESVAMEDLTKLAVADTGVKGRAQLRSKNFFALGLICWMFNRPTEPVLGWIGSKFGESVVGAANDAAFRAGFNYGMTTEAFHHTYEVDPAALPAGEYTNVAGNQATAWGLIAGAQATKLPLFYGSYPITPASSILEELAGHKNFGVTTFQAEDEIAAVAAALGASFTGSLGVTGTSGPGVALKSETISLALQLELPLVVVNVQRAGPSTGMPTKTEQADLLQAMYGRHGEAPMPVIAASRPSDAFETAIEACRIAVNYMTPVILLTDGYIATSSEPWRLPDLDAIGDLSRPFASPNGSAFQPYARDPLTLARPWAIPGTAGLEHRVGGLEHADLTGNVSYDPENHERMTELREAKVAGIAATVPPQTVDGPDDADLLVVGWGSTYGAIRAAVLAARERGHSVAHAHLRHLCPFPPNLAEVLGRHRRVLVPELNRGQLTRVLRGEFLIDARPLAKIQGLPFHTSEIVEAIEAQLAELDDEGGAA